MRAVVIGGRPRGRSSPPLVRWRHLRAAAVAVRAVIRTARGAPHRISVRMPRSEPIASRRHQAPKTSQQDEKRTVDRIRGPPASPATAPRPAARHTRARGPHPRHVRASPSGATARLGWLHVVRVCVSHGSRLPLRREPDSWPRARTTSASVGTVARSKAPRPMLARDVECASRGRGGDSLSLAAEMYTHWTLARCKERCRHSADERKWEFPSCGDGRTGSTGAQHPKR